MRDRQRWQPEEDAILRAYVSKHGPREWSLLPQRMGLPSFHRDPKSCLERWKNYLRPGLKKGSLTQDEQSLVVSLQAKHGNKWKLIASHLPGRTPKRLGKWWEVFKEKQNKQKRDLNYSQGGRRQGGGARLVQPQQGEYDHILETFANKYMVKGGGTDQAIAPERFSLGGGAAAGDDAGEHGCVAPVLTLAPVGLSPPSSSPSTSTSCNTSGGCSRGGNVSSHNPLHHHGLPPAPQVIPPWMLSSTSSMPLPPCSALSSTTTVTGTTNSPSVSLSLSPSERSKVSPFVGAQKVAALSQLCRELEEGRQSWLQHKKEANWRLSRLEQQLESEKARKKRDKVEEVEAKIRALRAEETSCLDRIDIECREQLCAIQRDAEAKEAKMVEMWAAKHAKLARLLDQMGSSAVAHHHGHHGNGKDL